MKTMRPPEPAFLLPFARSYRVVPGRLFAGFFPGDRDPAVGRGKLSALPDCGVTHIVNLMRETDADPLGRLRALTAPVREHFPQVPETSEQQGFVRRWRVGQ